MTRPETIARDERALQLQAAGLTLSVIAARLGVDRRSAYAMTVRARARLAAQEEDT